MKNDAPIIGRVILDNLELTHVVSAELTVVSPIMGDYHEIRLLPENQAQLEYIRLIVEDNKKHSFHVLSDDPWKIDFKRMVTVAFLSVCMTPDQVYYKVIMKE